MLTEQRDRDKDNDLKFFNKINCIYSGQNLLAAKERKERRENLKLKYMTYVFSLSSLCSFAANLSS